MEEENEPKYKSSPESESRNRGIVGRQDGFYVSFTFLTNNIFLFFSLKILKSHPAYKLAILDKDFRCLSIVSVTLLSHGVDRKEIVLSKSIFET